MIEPLKQDIHSIKQDVQSLKQDHEQTHEQLSQLTEDMKDFFHQTGEKMETANERITRLEQVTDLTHRN